MKSVFVQRNGVKPVAKEGVNYEKSIVPRSSATCDLITTKFGEKIPEEFKPTTLFYVSGDHSGSRLGEQVISMISDNETFKASYIFEDEHMSPFIKNNMAMYKITKFRVEIKKFKSIPSKMDGSALFFDFSNWENHDVPLTYFDEDILNVIKRIKNASAIAVLVPVGYELPEDDTLGYDTIEIIDVNGERIYDLVIIGKPKEADQWQTELRIYIYDLLNNVEKDERKLLRLVDDVNIEIWKRVFTHESYDRKFNYENDELFGDKLLDMYFDVYLMNKYPGINKNEITSLRHYYLAEIYQPVITRSLKMVPLIRTVKKVNRKMEEDVLESFFAGVYHTANNLMAGWGYILAHKMAFYVFDTIDIEIYRAEGPVKTIVRRDIFVALGLSEPEEVVIKTYSGYDGQILINGRTKDFFDKNGIFLEHDLIVGKGVGSSPSVAITNAYENTIKYLRGNGATPEFITKYKERNKFGKIPKYEDVVEKYQSDEILSIDYNSKNTEEGVFAQILGTKDTRYRNWDIVLASGTFSSGKDDTYIKEELFEIYLSE